MAHNISNVTTPSPIHLSDVEIYRRSHPQTLTLAYVAIALGGVGLLGNATLIVITQSRRLEHMTSRIFLAPLAICDFFVILFEMANYIIEYLHGLNTAQVLYGGDSFRCRFGMFFYTYLTASSSWLLVCFVVERYIWICKPHERPLIQSSKRTFYVTVGVAVCMLAGSFPFLVLTSYSPQRNACASDYELFYDIYLEVVFDILIITLTPSIYIIVCLTRVIWTSFLKPAEKLQIGFDANFGEKKRTHEQDMSKLTVSLGLLFLVSALPRCATSIVYTMLYHMPNLQLNFYQLYWINAVCRVVFLLNYSLKIIAYILSSKAFREGLWSLCGYSQFDRTVYSGSASVPAVTNGHLPTKQAETRM